MFLLENNSKYAHRLHTVGLCNLKMSPTSTSCVIAQRFPIHEAHYMTHDTGGKSSTVPLYLRPFNLTYFTYVGCTSTLIIPTNI